MYYNVSILFICQWTRLLSCLAIVNSASMNVGVHVSSFRIMVFSGMRPVVEFLGHMVGYSWLFEEISILFSTAAVWEKFLKKS